MSAPEQWTLIRNNRSNRNNAGGQLRTRNTSMTTDGRNFERRRPNDATNFVTDDNFSDDNEDEENCQENIVLESPVVWNKFALIGDINLQIDLLLMKNNISPCSECGKLSEIGPLVYQSNWQWTKATDCEYDLEKYSKYCGMQFIFISVIPSFTQREYGIGMKIYFVHVKFDNYFLAVSECNNEYTINIPAYFGFLGDKPTHDPVSIESDNVEDNKTNFMQIMKIVEGKMKHDEFQEISEEEKKNPEKKHYYDPISKEDLSRHKKSIFRCKLFLEDTYSGYGKILDEKELEHKINLHNRRNCFQAFNGDIVDVMVFQTKKEKDTWSGRVIRVEESDVKPVNKIFLCKLTVGRADLMVPICNTIPVIEVDNKQARRRVKESSSNLVSGLQDVNGIDNLIQSQIKADSCKKFANMYFITLKTLHQNLETSLDRIQYVDSYRCDFIFLVIYRNWKSDSLFPRGEVVGLYTPDASFSKTLPLISVSCDISVVGIEEELNLKKEINTKNKAIKSLLKVNNNLIKKRKKIFNFKYSNQLFNEVAYSYEDLDDSYFRLGVHVANVQEYVKKGDVLDKYAMKQFYTFLLPVGQIPSVEAKPHYLFVESVTKDILSINKNRKVSVMSFYFLVRKESFIIEKKLPMEFEYISLTEEFDVKIVDEFVSQSVPPYEYLYFVYKTCLNHRIQRNNSHMIPPCWFYPDYTLKINFACFIISEEMDIITNKYVAELLVSKNIMHYPVNVENHILHENKLKDWRNEIREKIFIKFFPTLNNYFKPPVTTSKIKTIKVSSQFLDHTFTNKRFNLFKCDMLFPDVSFHFYKLNNIVAWNKIMARSQVGDSPFTVSLTKPLSCFSDLLLQRLVGLIYAGGINPYSDDDILDLCETYNDNKKIFEKYWKICRAYEIKNKFNDSSFILDCVYEDITDESIVFHHPFLRNVYHDSFILFGCLGLSTVTILSNDEDKNVKLEWRTKIFINGDERYDQSFENLFLLKDIYFHETVIWRPNLNSADFLTQHDKMKIDTLKSNNKYPTNLTSETSKYMDPKITFSFKLDKKQILRIQFNYNYSLGIMKIIPELLIVNPHLKVCLGHRHDPFKYFIHPDCLGNINYRRFTDLKEYKEQFRILNRIEGIEQTIQEKKSYFIHDVKIRWIGAKANEDKEDIYGVVLLDHSWCTERFIKLGHKNLKVQDPVNTLKRAVDYCKMEFLVCIQSFLKENNVYWLGHAQVSDVAYVGYKNDYQVHLTLKLAHSSFPFKPKADQLYSLEIMETPISGRVMDRSLRKLHHETVVESIIMKRISNVPHTNNVMIDYENEIESSMVHSCKLNTAQNEALKIAINSEFSLIWGPPGTGKTMVGCIIAYAFTQINKRSSLFSKSAVLYCGPSNKSVDVVAEKLMKTFGDKCPKLLRIFSGDIMNADFPYPGAIINDGTSKTPENLKKIALHYIIRLRGKPFAEKLTKYYEYFKINEFRNIVDRKEYSKVVNKYQSKLKMAFQQEVLDGEYEIILCTAIGSCKKFLDPLSITQVIIDESGMCSEPEALGPIVNRQDLQNTIFIGDHRQLRPIITSLAAKSKQLDKSLFERIYNPKKRYCTMLDIQYRMHPSICEFPSSFFYKNDNTKLTTALSKNWSGIPDDFILDSSRFNGLQYKGLKENYTSELDRNIVRIADGKWIGIRKSDFYCYPFYLDFTSKIPIYEKVLFINVEGSEMNREGSGISGTTKSKGNEAEVMAVGLLYESLIKKINKKSTASQCIMIITQYKLQESLLTVKCNEILTKLKIKGPPLVSTVVASQGSECDYVIFSTVRSLPHGKDIDVNPSQGWISKYLGFITDKNQFNVAITRAKKGLFIIGNSNLLSVNQNWHSLIEDLRSRDCIAKNIFDVCNKNIN